MDLADYVKLLRKLEGTPMEDIPLSGLNHEALAEQFRKEMASSSIYFTLDYLEEFCKFQSTYTPNIPFPTMGGQSMWDTLFERYGWKVQRHKLTGHVRILDDHDIRRAWGPMKQILIPILEHIREQKHYDERYRNWEMAPNCGVVFCGGGAKGAYQVGVWRRLRELGFEAEINGVAGASVGALNSLLFAQGDLDLAEDVWSTIKAEDLVQPNTSALKTLIQTAGASAGAQIGAMALEGIPMHWAMSGLALDVALKIGRPYFLAASALTAGAATYSLREWSKSAGLFSREFLDGIIKSKISPEKIERTSKLVYVSLAALSFPHLPGEQGKLQDMIFNAEYHCWHGRPFSEITERVLASAALPAAYTPITLNGKLYVDGGVVDNCPVRPLAEAKFHTIFAVHLSPPEKEAERQESLEAASAAAGVSEVIHIWPSRDLGGTLEISRDLTLERMRLGYQDACEQLAKFT